jgi:hypothetical protein
MDAFPLPKPLNIHCTSSDCEKGLHCFRKTRRLAQENKVGRCRSCGADLVDWRRVHRQDLTDIDYTFQSLRFELIRHYFWHIEIDERAVAHARRKGRAGMRLAIDRRIRTSIGPADPAFDGRQTPASGNAVYYAQHAVAACCRKCLEEWHGIALGRPLTDGEIEYLGELAMRYVDERLPSLTETGERVPPLRVLTR